ncbi:helix-hairpin-helix domain-containing protein [Aquabacterium sp. OR-4]|uniref:helix-hairpin-helix domain-containing protein n=1 Tax=Aquabacterium sp. OR-4 TaxID=2978127 RepID=UPI0028C8E219|nr:helix-hairpin-helix domain-containing protein [Aquabacterium sp. OR-4]MDT7838585.1 helix-hairpin-helix domain-containing protein [Aquabacterium sp. OR-4]
MTEVPTFRRFSEPERLLLLRERGVGERVVERLEAAGYGSIARIHEAGVDTVVHSIAQACGSRSWANRRRALQRVLASVNDKTALNRFDS